MKGSATYLSGFTGIALSAAVVLSSATAHADEPGKDTSEWLSIGIPENLRDSGTGVFGMTSEIGRFSVGGGRINPSFGLAWDRSRGLHGTTMSGESEPLDGYSFSTGVKFDPPGFGSHSLSGRTFVLDDSWTRSGFASRNRGRSAAGADYADESPSFNMVLEGGGLPILPTLTYRLALINPGPGDGMGEHPAGFAAGLFTRFDLGYGISIAPGVEAAKLTAPAGMLSARERERHYWSTSMLTEWRNWNLGLAYTQRETQDRLSAGSEYRARASIGYVFDFGLSADLGWYRLRDEEEATDQFGLRFTYPLRIGR